MTRLPQRPDISQLKKQAKDLLALVRSGTPEAVARIEAQSPAGRLQARDVRLADAQFCIAREHGFRSWPDLAAFIEARKAHAADRPAAVLALLRLIYAGDIAGGTGRARPAAAARLIEESPDLVAGDPWLSCALGDEARIRQLVARDPSWVHAAGGPLMLPPLVAVTHSSFVRLPAYRDPLHETARVLLDAGADPDQSVHNRWAASPEAPDETSRLSALYGAAGQNHDAELTRLLLAGGADPNDNESLYHALESPACTRMLLEAGARVTGTNALYRALDLADPDPLRLLLAHGGDPNEPATSKPKSESGTPLLWAIRRRSSLAHVSALTEAGADVNAATPDGTSAEALALRFGLPDVAALLRGGGARSTPATDAEAFVAACARGDAEAARAIQSRRPDLPATLSDTGLRMLPELAALGCNDAVRLMVDLGWPLTVRGGDWHASALNHAIFRGDAALTRFLLAHGADWREEHGFGDNALGTLAWASLNEPVEEGDWTACAAVLRADGLPDVRRDPGGSPALVIDGVKRRFSDAVTDVLLYGPPDQASRVAGQPAGG